MSRNIEQDVAFIRALADLLRESDLTEIEVRREYGEDDELKVRLSRATRVVEAPAVQGALPAPVAVQPAAEPAPADPPEPQADAITSPMVGTAYLQPEPGAPSFVEVGDTVAEGQTILIIEAMKTMNQIPSPCAGTVKAILVSNAEPVEYGAPLMIIA